MTIKQQKSKLIKEMTAEILMALLFLFIAFHRPITEFLFKFDETLWYEGTAIITQSKVVDKIKKNQGPLANRTTHTYYVHAQYQYDSMGTTYESDKISNLGNYIIANGRTDAYEAINTYLQKGQRIKVNISKNPPTRSFLFRDKLPNSNNRFEIIMFLIALLALYSLNKSIRQFRHLSQKRLEDKKDKHLGQPNSVNPLNH